MPGSRSQSGNRRKRQKDNIGDHACGVENVRQMRNTAYKIKKKQHQGDGQGCVLPFSKL
ncbi:MAG: hypothetical protein ACLUD2_19070 [Clostridium sp.]